MKLVHNYCLYNIIFILAIAQLSESHYACATECCLSYYNLLDDYVDAQWCDKYCCGSTALDLGLYCCDQELLQAPEYDRSDFCILWWKHHVWAPIIVAVVCVGMVVCCCFCCYKCCCANRTTVVYQNPGAAGPSVNTTVVQSSMTNQSTGYNQPVQMKY